MQTKWRWFLLAILLTGCDEPLSGCEEQKVIIFENCLSLAAEARKGRDYTTNDDEDFDDVIAECRITANSIYFRKKCKRKPQ